MCDAGPGFPDLFAETREYQTYDVLEIYWHFLAAIGPAQVRVAEQRTDQTFHSRGGIFNGPNEAAGLVCRVSIRAPREELRVSPNRSQGSVRGVQFPGGGIG